MRLSRSYQPRTLEEVVGQPAVNRRLKRLVAAPGEYRQTVLLSGMDCHPGQMDLFETDGEVSECST